MQLIAFELTMPSPPSWNGRWSGEDRLHCKIERLTHATAARVLERTSYSYHWPDGWTAVISVRQVTKDQAAKLRRSSVGFAGYDWMVRSIVDHGEIKA